ncbi:MAG: ATP-binding protein [Anaerovoracaceae bacterium]|jgi:hypothetical protein
MNIRQAKEQVRKTVEAYLEKDNRGRYRIPVEQQRPIFMIGAPGIGKTAVMEQVSRELGLAFVSYSMTHHTRQSALGLPVITHKSFEGFEYDVTEYTMSEIISSIYDEMKETGKREGILFLDEINCVSETLIPSMLQFLQFKTFGRHRVPDGWVVVTAGNPPEYNRMVHEFDMVTMDRLKYIEVEPDYDAWRDYAIEKGVHPAVLSYLDLKPSNFFVAELSAEGRRYVTARGWEDLSEMIRLLEHDDLGVDSGLAGQYIHHPVIAREFSAYYDLFLKYRSDYHIADILEGKAPEEIRTRASEAGVDERIAICRLMLDAVYSDAAAVRDQEEICLDLKKEKSPDLKAEVEKLRTMSGALQEKLHNMFDFAAGVFGEGNEMLIIVSELTVNSDASNFISHYGSRDYFKYSDTLMFSERNKNIRRKFAEFENELAESAGPEDSNGRGTEKEEDIR